MDSKCKRILYYGTSSNDKWLAYSFEKWLHPFLNSWNGKQTQRVYPNHHALEGLLIAKLFCNSLGTRLFLTLIMKPHWRGKEHFLQYTTSPSYMYITCNLWNNLINIGSQLLHLRSAQCWPVSPGTGVEVWGSPANSGWWCFWTGPWGAWRVTDNLPFPPAILAIPLAPSWMVFPGSWAHTQWSYIMQ